MTAAGRSRAVHRDHAIIEQVITELRDGPLAHQPSGSCPANAAWLAQAVIASTSSTSPRSPPTYALRTARWATLRRKIVIVLALVIQEASCEPPA